MRALVRPGQQTPVRPAFARPVRRGRACRAQRDADAYDFRALFSDALRDPSSSIAATPVANVADAAGDAAAKVAEKAPGVALSEAVSAAPITLPNSLSDINPRLQKPDLAPAETLGNAPPVPPADGGSPASFLDRLKPKSVGPDLPESAPSPSDVADDVMDLLPDKDAPGRSFFDALRGVGDRSDDAPARSLFDAFRGDTADKVAAAPAQAVEKAATKAADATAQKVAAATPSPAEGADAAAKKVGAVADKAAQKAADVGQGAADAIKGPDVTESGAKGALNALTGDGGAPAKPLEAAADAARPKFKSLEEVLKGGDQGGKPPAEAAKSAVEGVQRAADDAAAKVADAAPLPDSEPRGNPFADFFRSAPADAPKPPVEAAQDAAAKAAGGVQRAADKVADAALGGPEKSPTNPFADLFRTEPANPLEAAAQGAQKAADKVADAAPRLEAPDVFSPGSGKPSLTPPELPSFDAGEVAPPSLPELPDLPQLRAPAPSAVDRARGAADSVSDAAASAARQVTGAVDSAKAFVTGAQADLSAGVAKAKQALRFEAPALPPAVQSKLSATSASWAAASDRFNEAPVGYTVLVTLGLAALGFTFWKLEYGGLAGVYKKPEKLLVALNGEDNILVVDVRQDAELERDGMLDLKRQARGKAVHLPYVPVPGAVDGNIDDRGGFQRRLNAALITGLQPVNSFTKIIIMDGRGGGAAKALAREVSALGYRGYHFQGGFRAWKNTGLATMEDGEYGVSAAGVLSDKGEEFSELAQRTVAELSKPVNTAITAGAVVTTLSAIARPHETFQFLGVLGLELTLLARLLRYDSPMAAVRDWSERSANASKAIGNAVGGVASGAGKAAQSVRRPAAKAAPAAAPPPAEEKAPPASRNRMADQSAAAKAAMEEAKAMMGESDTSGSGDSGEGAKKPAPAKAEAAAPAKPPKPEAAAPSKPRDTEAAAPAKPQKTEAAAPSKPRETEAATPSKPREPELAAPSKPRETEATAPAKPRESKFRAMAAKAPEKNEQKSDAPTAAKADVPKPEVTPVSQVRAPAASKSSGADKPAPGSTNGNGSSNGSAKAAAGVGASSNGGPSGDKKGSA